jgi:hypothetical protein
MRRLLLISPHFPPDTTAGTHRARLLAPHLPAHGWEPTVLTVDPRDYEGRLDPELAALVPEGLRVLRCRALSARWTRLLGIGDLGLRALPGLSRAAARLLSAERFDAVFITIYPTYPALLGPRLRRRFGVPFVLDYQDPWVGSWGETVGGGDAGAVDWKSRASRALALRLEPRAARAASALTAVSAATCEAVLERYPELSGLPYAEIPLGAEPADFERVRERPRPNGFFDPADGRFHLCYVGTLLPLGFETLRAFFAAVARLRERRPDLYGRLALHFFGTSNQTSAEAPERALPVARELGVADRVTEVAPRIDYLDAVRVQTQANGLLLLGSSEAHYTASKLFPALLSRRPLLALYHERSTVVEMLRRGSPTARCVPYGDAERAGDRVEEIYTALAALLEDPAAGPVPMDPQALAELSAEAMAGRLARVLDSVAEPRAAA